ncbi:MAG: hypothetical protein ACRDKI_03975 [Solirubrobacterales bacterium]
MLLPTLNLRFFLCDPLLFLTKNLFVDCVAIEELEQLPLLIA